jgi:uncharacterized membrane protein YbhN (UPF0104 family)
LFDGLARLKLTSHIYQYFSAGYFNLFLPSSIGGDTMRVMWSSKSDIIPTAAFSLIVIERLLGVGSLILLSVVASFWLELPSEIELIVMALLLLTVAIFALLLFVHRYWRSWAVNIRWVTEALNTVDSVIANPWRLLAVFLASILYQIITVGITHLVVLAFSLPVDGLAIYALVPLLWFATFLPISVGGLSVREASFIFLFATVGVEHGAALIMSIGIYAIFAFAGIVGGVWFSAAQFRLVKEL